MNKIHEWLLSNGFSECYNHIDYDCAMPIGSIHSLYWSDKLNHFAIGVFNEMRKKEAGGVYNQWHYTLIPKPIYSIDIAKLIITALTP